MVGYLALMGEAIHCQYFPHDHTGHNNPSSPVSHTTHCLTAVQSASAAIHSVVPLSHSPLELLGLTLSPTAAPPETVAAFAQTTRAPPSI